MRTLSLIAMSALAAIVAVACTPRPAPQTSNEPARATVQSEPNRVSDRQTEVMVAGTGGNIALLEQEILQVGAKEVMDNQITAEGFATAAWNDQVRTATRMKPGTVTRRRRANGVQEISGIVVVDHTTLINWADQNGYMRATNPVGDLGNAPDPTIVMLPEDIAGEFNPRALTDDERTVQTVLNGAAIDDPYNLTILSYHDVVGGARNALENRSGTADLVDYAIAADIYIKYTIRVEPAANGTVRATGILQGIMVTTGEVAISREINGATVRSEQRSAAVRSAAEDAVGSFFEGLFRRWQSEFEDGIPFAVRLTNVGSLDEAIAVRQALTTVSGDGRLNDPEFEQESGIFSVMIRAEPLSFGDAFDFIIQVRTALNAQGYTIDNPLMNRRFISGTLMPQ